MKELAVSLSLVPSCLFFLIWCSLSSFPFTLSTKHKMC